MKKWYVVALSLVVLLTVSVAFYASASSAMQGEPPTLARDNGRLQRFVGERFARTELYFGSAKPDGSIVVG
jgi:hypothetical protein